MGSLASPLSPHAPLALLEPGLEARRVVHGAVEAVGLLRVALAQQDPAVGGELARRARLPRVCQLPTSLREHAGQAVDHIRRVAIVDGSWAVVVRMVVVRVVVVSQFG